jgi:hypothetical protein
VRGRAALQRSTLQASVQKNVGPPVQVMEVAEAALQMCADRGVLDARMRTR